MSSHEHRHKHSGKPSRDRHSGPSLTLNTTKHQSSESKAAVYPPESDLNDILSSVLLSDLHWQRPSLAASHGEGTFTHNERSRVRSPARTYSSLFCVKSWNGSAWAGLAELGLSKRSWMPNKICLIVIEGFQSSSSLSILSNSNRDMQNDINFSVGEYVRFPHLVIEFHTRLGITRLSSEISYCHYQHM